MTTFGFLATNGNSQVLISSKTKNLHFLGKATLYSTLQSHEGRGGIRRWAYRIDSTGTPVPFFSVPTADRYAIVRMTRVTGITWEIEVIRSGTSGSVPEVYVFTEITSQHRPTGAWGMQVLNEIDSTPAYDSRLKPLVVRGGTNVTPPYDPMTSLPTGLSPRYCSTNADGLFVPNNYSSTVVYNTNVTKPIVCYQSVAQTMRQVDVNESSERCWGIKVFGNCIGFEGKKSWDSHYWTFFRAGVSAEQSGPHSYINTGWISVDYGCRNEEKESDSFIGIGYDSDSSAAGNWPFSNLTINLTSVSLIVSDGVLYD